MSVARVNRYAKCIEPLMAQEALSMLPVTTFPHMRKDKAKSLEKKLKKASKFDIHKDSDMTTEDLYHHLMRTLGNG